MDVRKAVSPYRPLPCIVHRKKDTSRRGVKYPKNPVQLLLPFLLHIRDQFQHAVQEGKEGEGRTGEADACDRDIRAEEYAFP